MLLWYFLWFFVLIFQTRGLHFRHTDNINHWLRAMEHLNFPKVRNTCRYSSFRDTVWPQESSGPVILLTVTLEWSMNSQNIWRRVGDRILRNNSPWNIFWILHLLERYQPSSQAFFAALGMNESNLSKPEGWAMSSGVWKQRAIPEISWLPRHKKEIFSAKNNINKII